MIDILSKIVLKKYFAVKNSEYWKKLEEHKSDKVVQLTERID